MLPGNILVTGSQQTRQKNRKTLMIFSVTGSRQESQTGYHTHMVFHPLISETFGQRKFIGKNDSKPKLKYSYQDIAPAAYNMELILYQAIQLGKNSGTHA